MQGMDLLEYRQEIENHTEIFLRWVLSIFEINFPFRDLQGVEVLAQTRSSAEMTEQQQVRQVITFESGIILFLLWIGGCNFNSTR
jgi:hypothetical protein